DDERNTVLAFLDYLRESVVAKLRDVPEVLARKALVPSGTSLYWLASHLTAVEINQFQRTLDGRAESDLVPSPPPANDSHEMAVSRYELACAESRSIVESFPDLGMPGRGRDRR